MKPEKMTPWQLELMLGRVSEPMRSVLRAHISAVEAERLCEGCGVTVSARAHCVTCWEEMKAERDAVTKTLDALGVPSEADEHGSGRACDLAGRVRLLGNARDNLTTERDALRKRVQALEAELKETRDSLSVETGLRKDMREELATLRGKRSAKAQVNRASGAERELASIRQRAEHLIDAGRPSWVDAARYVVGEDAAGGGARASLDENRPCCGHTLGKHDAVDGCTEVVNDPEPGDRCPCVESLTSIAPPASPEPTTNVCEHGDHPAPEGQRFCSLACQRCESTDHDGDGCAGTCSQSPEPTTAEAFATLRTCVAEKRNVEALSLLERRMGAMVSVAKEAESMLGRLTSPVPGPIDRRRDVDPLRLRITAALTDAPRVYTAEEVGEATAVPTWTDDMPTEYGAGFREGFERALASVRKHLSALRKGT